MNKSISTIAALALAGGAGLAFAPSASAHFPNIEGTCLGLNVNLSNYETKPAVPAVYETVVVTPHKPAVEEVSHIEYAFERTVIDVEAVEGVPAVTETQTKWSTEPTVEGWTHTGETRKVVTTEAVPAVPAVDEVSHQEYIFERTTTTGGTGSVVVGGKNGYTVSDKGVTLNKGKFKNGGHVNWEITGTDGVVRSGGIHFDPNTGHPGSGYIGKNFVPIDLAPGECITWVQVDGFNDHLGEGEYKNKKVCATHTKTERTDWVRTSPGDDWKQVDERKVVDVEAVEGIPGVEEVSHLEYEHTREVTITEAVEAVDEVSHVEKSGWVLESPEGEGWEKVDERKVVDVEASSEVPEVTEERLVTPGVDADETPNLVVVVINGKEVRVENFGESFEDSFDVKSNDGYDWSVMIDAWDDFGALQDWTNTFSGEVTGCAPVVVTPPVATDPVVTPPAVEGPVVAPPATLPVTATPVATPAAPVTASPAGTLAATGTDARNVIGLAALAILGGLGLTVASRRRINE